jgi:hypothetical protein
MDRTRLSLFYLAGYLLPTGLALILAPETAMKLLQAHQFLGRGVRSAALPPRRGGGGPIDLSRVGRERMAQSRIISKRRGFPAPASGRGLRPIFEGERRV